MLTKTMTNKVIITFAFFGLFSMGVGFEQTAQAENPNKPTVRTMKTIEHWTPERRAQAIPRDLFIDERGLGYLRKPNGEFVPHGHETPVEKGSSGGISAFGKPSGDSDTTPPIITVMDPIGGAEIGYSHIFKTTVTDDSGVKSVKFNITKDGGITQSFTPNAGAGNVWSIELLQFTNGKWTWDVVAKDNASKGGNTATSDSVSFTVDTSNSGGGGGGSSDAITNSVWADGGKVQTAAGRLYFEMPGNSKRKGPWSGYVCSGTVATDDILDSDGTLASDNGRSIIITAAHCVYDDVNKAFARNVLFIPDQAGTTGTQTDLNCSNDPVGCWAPSGGLVDENWAINTFPANIKWDYAYYVVNDSGSHTSDADGLSGTKDSSILDSVAGSLTIDFTNAAPGVEATALGYSYSEDPKFMYCQEDMTVEGAVNWWLPSCELSGGSSGGSWLQPLSVGDGSIISINSWGYTTAPGMAGPLLNGTSSAECVFGVAKSSVLSDLEAAPYGDAGSVINCP